MHNFSSENVATSEFFRLYFPALMRKRALDIRTGDADLVFAWVSYAAAGIFWMLFVNVRDSLVMFEQKLFRAWLTYAAAP